MNKLFVITAILLSAVLLFTACSGNHSNAETAQIANGETYTCTMHNEVMSEKPAKCPKCGMTLVKQNMTDEQIKMMKEGTYTKPEN